MLGLAMGYRPWPPRRRRSALGMRCLVEPALPSLRAARRLHALVCERRRLAPRPHHIRPHSFPCCRQALCSIPLHRFLLAAAHVRATAHARPGRVPPPSIPLLSKGFSAPDAPWLTLRDLFILDRVSPTPSPSLPEQQRQRQRQRQRRPSLRGLRPYCSVIPPLPVHPRLTAFTMRLTHLLSLIALCTSFVSAHIVITYPGWRGDNLITNDTFPYGMQWMYPCKSSDFFLEKQHGGRDG